MDASFSPSGFPPCAIEEPKRPSTTFLLSSKGFFKSKGNNQPPFGERRVGLSSSCANSIVEDSIFEAKQLGAHHLVSELSFVAELHSSSIMLVQK